MRRNFEPGLLSPRRVPWTVRALVLLGGSMGQFGWLFLGISLIFVWVFGSMMDFKGPLFWIFPTSTTPGIVQSVSETSAEVNDTPVYEYRYSFRVERLEQQFSGVAYTPGHRFNVGDTVTVTYLTGNPELSKVEGASRSAFPVWGLLFILPFLAVGGGFIAYDLWQGWKALSLMRTGRLAEGRLKSKQYTSARVNNRPVYKLTFEFTADDGLPHTATSRTSQIEYLQDDAEELLLYDPQNPKRVVFLDTLPGGPTIDEFGDITLTRTRWLAARLALPALVIGVHGTIFLWLLLF